WNEPNLTHFWASGPDPARYTELLRGARAAVKGVAPRMPVLGGSLAPVRGEETTAIGEGLLPFLRGMYANGARGLMDGISLHPYPFGRFHGGVYETIDATLAARDAAGDRTPLWLTETGLSTTDGYNAVQQAMVLGDLVPRLRRRPEVRGVFVHTLVDPARPNPADPEDGFGIMRGPRAVKPAFCALARRHCKSPGLPLPTRRAWSAQERLQSAVEGALAYHRQMSTYSGLTTSVLHALVPRLSAIAPDESALPGPASRPSRIAVLDVTGGTTVRLCNASKFARSYCVTISPGEVFRFTTALGSIGAAASAADAPDAETW
ncbi:MAG: polysaccharide biosynthesis protein PslG, partial [Solirubrobacteraceae bacterium]|nr:polysaccharide biosynthesis protein PslG [Solirubrobacteraceae bacterium]